MNPRATRRSVLAAGGAALVATGVAHADPFSTNAIGDDLARYISFGKKHAGGDGDNAAGAWLEGELRAAGFTVARQAFQTPFFDAGPCALTVGATGMALLPQGIVRVTDPITAPLVVAARGVAAAMRDAIVVVPLSHRRWSTAVAPEITGAITAASQGGARAVVLVTNGPTGEAIALNADAHKPWPLPVAVLAPKDASAAYDAAARGAMATFALTGRGGERSAFNLVATLERRKGKRLVVSTPRSGWTVCAGERGGGVAAWLATARWSVEALREHDLTFLCTSGHEYENLGGETFLQCRLAPRPESTHLWAHIGANFAARDWHEAGPRLLALPSIDPNRFLVGADAMLPVLRAAFRGAPGLEQPYPTSSGTAGELTNIIAAGHQRAFGIFGAHRFHHVASDDVRCVDVGQVATTALKLRNAVAALAA